MLELAKKLEEVARLAENIAYEWDMDVGQVMFSRETKKWAEDLAYRTSNDLESCLCKTLDDRARGRTR